MRTVKLDFSQYHPIDHPITACRGYHGGIRQHLQNIWDFEYRARVVTRWAHLTGRHAWVCVGNRSLDGDWSFTVRCAGETCDVVASAETMAREIGNLRNNRGFRALADAVDNGEFDTDND